MDMAYTNTQYGARGRLNKKPIALSTAAPPITFGWFFIGSLFSGMTAYVKI